MNNTIISNEDFTDIIKEYANEASKFIHGIFDKEARSLNTIESIRKYYFRNKSLEKVVDYNDVGFPKTSIEIEGLSDIVFSKTEKVSWKTLKEQLENVYKLTNVYTGDLVTLLKGMRDAKDKARPFNGFNLKLIDPNIYYLGSGFISDVEPNGKIHFGKRRDNKAKILETPSNLGEFTYFLWRLDRLAGDEAILEVKDAFTEKKIRDYVDAAYNSYSYNWKKGEKAPGGYSVELMDMAAKGVSKVLYIIAHTRLNMLYAGTKIAKAVHTYVKNNISTEEFDMTDTIGFSYEDYDKIQGDLNFKFKELNSALSDNSTLKTLCKDIRCSLESGDGIDTDAAKVLEAVVANIYDRNGIPKKHHPNFVSLEGINDGFDRINLAKSFLVSLEEEQQKQEGSTEENKTEGESEKKDEEKKEKKTGILEKIYNTICEMLSKLKDMLFNGLESVAANAKKLRADIKSNESKIDTGFSYKWEKENFEAKDKEDPKDYASGTNAISDVTQWSNKIKEAVDISIKNIKEAVDKKQVAEVNQEQVSLPVLKSIGLSGMSEVLKVLDEKVGLEGLAMDIKKTQADPTKTLYEQLKSLGKIVTDSSVDEDTKKKILESVKNVNKSIDNEFKAIAKMLADILKGCSKWFEEAKKKKSESK